MLKNPPDLFREKTFPIQRNLEYANSSKLEGTWLELL